MHSPLVMVVGVVTELTLARGDVTEAVGDADDGLSDSVVDDTGDDAAEGVLVNLLVATLDNNIVVAVAS